MPCQLWFRLLHPVELLQHELTLEVYSSQPFYCHLVLAAISAAASCRFAVHTMGTISTASGMPDE